MDGATVFVLSFGTLLIAFTLWFFLGPREATAVKSNTKGVQEINIIVKGGYSPDRIEVQQGQPVRLNFRREESNSCTEQVVFGDFNITKNLPQGETVPIEFTPEKSGEFPFHCAMNMVRGKIIVRP